MKGNISRSTIFRDKMRRETEKKREEFEKKVESEMAKCEKPQKEDENEL